MGHTTLEMTRRCAHLAPDSKRNVAMLLQGSLEQKLGKVFEFPRQANLA